MGRQGRGRLLRPAAEAIRRDRRRTGHDGKQPGTVPQARHHDPRHLLPDLPARIQGRLRSAGHRGIAPLGVHRTTDRRRTTEAANRRNGLYLPRSLRTGPGLRRLRRAARSDRPDRPADRTRGNARKRALLRFERRQSGHRRRRPAPHRRERRRIAGRHRGRSRRDGLPALQEGHRPGRIAPGLRPVGNRGEGAVRRNGSDSSGLDFPRQQRRRGEIGRDTAESLIEQLFSKQSPQSPETGMCLRTERILSACLSNRPQSERTVEERKLSGIPEKYFCIADFLITFASRYRGVEQLAARWAHNPKVGSSSLPSATKI